MSASLVGSEMCIRDRGWWKKRPAEQFPKVTRRRRRWSSIACSALGSRHRARAALSASPLADNPARAQPSAPQVLDYAQPGHGAGVQQRAARAGCGSPRDRLP
eukprot:502063-Alexandrium_andersonii.AAC.1